MGEVSTVVACDRQQDDQDLGDAHERVFVWYDEAGEPHPVRDQGGFHSGINPALGKVLSY